MFDKRYANAAVLVGVVILGLAIVRCEPTFVDATVEDGRYQNSVKLYGAGEACPANLKFCSAGEGTPFCCPTNLECCGGVCCSEGFRCEDSTLGLTCVAVDPQPTPTVNPNPQPTPTIDPNPQPTPTIEPQPTPTATPATLSIPTGCPNGTVINVNGGDLQLAVTNAPNNAVVVVGPGTYSAPLSIPGPLTLIGSPAQAPRINGDIFIQHPNVCVVDLDVAAGIVVDHPNCTIAGNKVGALIFLNPPTSGCTVRDNAVGGCIPNLGTGNTRTGNTCQANPGTGCTSNPVPCNN